MGESADFLVEVGTEELPPKALRGLMTAFADGLSSELTDANIQHGPVTPYASPRRLAVLVEKLAKTQSYEEAVVKGPPVSVAYDDKGKLTRAGRAFAKKYDVAEDRLETLETDKGERLVYRRNVGGKEAAALIPAAVEAALSNLPIPRRMRWGDGDAEFVRPVHWLVMLHGKKPIDATLFGLKAAASTRGHRFHEPGEIKLAEPSKYLPKLKRARVIADFDERRKVIVDGVRRVARQVGGEPVATEALYDEVAALTEWPVPLVGSFDESFLSLPREVIVATLSGHQRYFPIADNKDKLLPRFVTVANLESADPDRVPPGRALSSARRSRLSAGPRQHARQGRSHRCACHKRGRQHRRGRRNRQALGDARKM
jgi:glycyl-tRNA synthetase beta chain